MKRPIRLIVILSVFVVLAGIQVIRPNFINPPVTGEIVAPAAVATALRTSCYDCHSNETRYPWYSKVAPASWMLAYDIGEGRKHLNFSEWTALPAEKQAKKLRKIAGQVNEGEMPEWYYTLVHRDAVLTDVAKKAIVDWARGPATSAPTSDQPRQVKEEPGEEGGEDKD